MGTESSFAIARAPKTWNAVCINQECISSLTFHSQKEIIIIYQELAQQQLQVYHDPR